MSTEVILQESVSNFILSASFLTVDPCIIKIIPIKNRLAIIANVHHLSIIKVTEKSLKKYENQKE